MNTSMKWLVPVTSLLVQPATRQTPQSWYSHPGIVVFGDAHLRRILAAYTVYYNELRTHLSLDKDSPGRRPIQRHGQLATRSILGGLHHQYCRI